MNKITLLYFEYTQFVIFTEKPNYSILTHKLINLPVRVLKINSMIFHPFNAHSKHLTSFLLTHL